MVFQSDTGFFLALPRAVGRFFVKGALSRVAKARAL